MSLLRIRDLSAGYRRENGEKFTILQIPEFTIESPSQVCMKGRSGSGKTTFLNAISGILIPFSGSIQLDEVELTKLGEAQRDITRGKKIGFIFQTFNLISGFTSLENVILGSVFAGDPNEEASNTRKRAEELLNKVGLSDRLNHFPGQLSSGEQQRVAIARALINRPKLILADEPTGSLDETTGKLVLELICKLTSESKAALLLVTHDPSVMDRFERIVDLKELNRVL